MGGDLSQSRSEVEQERNPPIPSGNFSPSWRKCQKCLFSPLENRPTGRAIPRGLGNRQPRHCAHTHPEGPMAAHPEGTFGRPPFSLGGYPKSSASGPATGSPARQRESALKGPYNAAAPCRALSHPKLLWGAPLQSPPVMPGYPARTGRWGSLGTGLEGWGGGWDCQGSPAARGGSRHPQEALSGWVGVTRCPP